MEIIKMAEDTWRIEEEGVRFFLLAGQERALLIDSGMETHDAKEIAQELVRLPVGLLNTHADRDHVGSNGEFETFYMHPAEASNYYNTQKKTGAFTPIEDGDVIDLGGRKLEIVAIPGHTPGSVAVLDIGNRVLYSGDTVQDGSIPVKSELIAQLHQAALSVAAGDAEGVDACFHGIPLKRYDMGCAAFLFDAPAPVR